LELLLELLLKPELLELLLPFSLQPLLPGPVVEPELPSELDPQVGASMGLELESSRGFDAGDAWSLKGRTQPDHAGRLLKKSGD
jgi:hypothetical protein